MEITIGIIAIIYCLCGAGTISLVRAGRINDFPKALGIVWPVLLLFAAFGLFDRD